MPIHYFAVRTAAVTTSCMPSQSERAYIATLASGTQTFFLPSASPSGQTFTFICGSAAGEILISPRSNNTISVKASEGGANVTPTAGTGIKNTGATNILGDRVTLMSDGSTGWHAISQSGTWASQ